MLSLPAQKRRFPLIHLIILSGVLVFVIKTSGVATAITGDESEPAVRRLGEMVVTATRLETPMENISANVTVITRADMEKLPVATVAEVLQYTPGVYVEFNGGPGSMATDISIQGSETRHVTVFQDGVPLNQLANPLTDLSYLPIDAIERIEVYKGAASSAWGSGLGGVVNIITRDPDTRKPVSADIRFSKGEFDTLKTRGTVSGGGDRIGYLLSVTHDESDGFIAHTEFEHEAIYAKLQYNVGQSGGFSIAVFNDDGDNADPMLIFPEHWDDIDRKRSYQKLRFKTPLGGGWEMNLEGHHHRWKALIKNVFPERTGLFLDYRDETWGGSGRLTYGNAANHRFNIGFDGHYGEYDWQRYDRTYDTDIWAFYANDSLTLGNLVVNTGIRYDDDSTFGGAVSPVFGLVYHLWHGKALVRFQVARGFSAPPAAWVQDPEYGNPDLDPETAVNYQLGGEIIPIPSLKLQWNLFRSDVDDLIKFNPATYQLENIDKVVRKGGEGTVTALFPLGLTVSFSGSYVDVRDDKTDKTIEDIPRTLYTARATHCYKRLTHTLTGTYTDHNSPHPETDDKKFIFNYRFNIDLSRQHIHGRPSLFGAVYNIGDSHYIYREAWPKPRRWVEVGLRVIF